MLWSILMLSDDSLRVLFTDARSYNGWLDKEVTNEQIRQIYALMKFAPTAANSCPARLTFLKSQTAKERLKPHLDAANVEKSMAAPVIAIIGYDTEFYQKLPFLFPHTDAKSWYAGKPDKIKTAAELNATLQGGYFIMASRAIGLDCGPMSGFNNQSLDEDFFPDATTKSLFICAIGYGDTTTIFPRSPRFSFEEACDII